MQTDKELQQKYAVFNSVLGERERRLIFAAEAKSLGRGGKALVSRLSGMSRVTLDAGTREIENQADALDPGTRSRKEGGGRKKEVDKNATLVTDLEAIVSPHTLGDPMKPLQWTNKSLRSLSEGLLGKGHRISHRLVGEILKQQGYSLQSNRKTDEGGAHPDRDEQFEFINSMATDFLEKNLPVISVDCKKKEVLGPLKNKGEEWRPKGEPRKVKVYDFEDKALGKAIPYGIYEINNNEGWVNVGISRDTAAFAVASIRGWWNENGSKAYNGNKLYITADGGGSNSSRSRLWKSELQIFANETGLEISVSHYPPGTSKWNKIEHRLFSFISMNWKGRPLEDIQVVINLIANTTTKKGLKVKARLDENIYEKGIKVTDEEFEKIQIKRNEFHGEWNYVIKPQM